MNDLITINDKNYLCKIFTGKEILKQKKENVLGFDISVLKSNSKASCHVKEMHFPFPL